MPSGAAPSGATAIGGGGTVTGRGGAGTTTGPLPGLPAPSHGGTTTLAPPAGGGNTCTPCTLPLPLPMPLSRPLPPIRAMACTKSGGSGGSWNSGGNGAGAVDEEKEAASRRPSIGENMFGRPNAAGSKPGTARLSKASGAATCRASWWARLWSSSLRRFPSISSLLGWLLLALPLPLAPAPWLASKGTNDPSMANSAFGWPSAGTKFGIEYETVRLPGVGLKPSSTSSTETT
mmetsp:Transcript_95809/g.310426  ORF Transcript_95809/g.310426 Transcript_95809/m.310426 type:complete len:233 (-) Transcript_95809:686-1384(-)